VLAITALEQGFDDCLASGAPAARLVEESSRSSESLWPKRAR
jgi:hypothetical protein